MSEKQTLKDWRKARDAMQALTRQAEEVRNASVRHRKAHPLTEEDKNRIRAHLKEGGFLCCESGHAFLQTLNLDECWVGFINEWFYEYAGCYAKYYGVGGDYREEMLNNVEKMLAGKGE